MNSTRTPNMQRNALRKAAVCFSTLGVAGFLAGCSAGLPGSPLDTVTGGANVHYTGSVHGGQQPVSGALVQMYAVGTTGLKSAATPLGSPATSDANGNFTLNSASYNCTSATEVYITATGGNSGSGTNGAIAMVATLGPCTSLSASTFVQINELTTVAAAYALAPFASDLTHVGAVGSYPIGMVNAFANSSQLVDSRAGLSPGFGLPAGTTVPSTEINTLGDILAACVNTSSSSSGPCNTLFTATAPATDTFAAALGIAKNPGAPAITGLYSLSSASAPFQPSMSTQPNDFSVAISSTGSGLLSTPYGLAMDASGNAWVTNESGTTVTEISNGLFTLANPTAPNLSGPQGVAIDNTGNVWVANTAGNSVVKFTLTGGAVSATGSFTTGGVLAPSAIAIDAQGNAFVSNFNGNTVTKFSNSGAAAQGTPFTGAGNITVPAAIAIDPSGNVYVTSGTGSVVEMSNAGAYLASLNDGTLQSPQGVAVDAAGRIVATGFTTGTAVGGALSQFTAAGAPVAQSPATSAVTTPAGVATDGTTIFVANSISGGGLVEFLYGSSTPISPGTGLGSLSTPVGVAIDASGSVWTANSGSNTISKYIGLAAPGPMPLSSIAGPH